MSMERGDDQDVRKNPYEGKKTYPLRLDDNLAAKFQEKCSRQGRTMSSVLQSLVLGYTNGHIKVDVKPKRYPKKKATNHDEPKEEASNSHE